MRFLMSLKKCPLLCMIVISIIFLTIATFHQVDVSNSGQSIDLYREPLLTMLFQDISDDMVPVSTEQNKVLTKDAFAVKEEGSSLQDLSGNTTVLSSNAVTADEIYEFQTVSEEYFDDALFIGDSRTVGLHDYAKMGNAVFYAETSMTIQKILGAEIVAVDEADEFGRPKSNITVGEALSKTGFGKIYIMLGINELGRGNTEQFFEEYKNVIASIRELQPQAIIFVEGIMQVAAEKSTADPIYNNQNINERNAALAALSNQKDIFYIDMNTAVSDGLGNLNKDYTYDGIHLKASHYDKWKDFLLQNGIVKK